MAQRKKAIRRALLFVACFVLLMWTPFGLLVWGPAALLVGMMLPQHVEAGCERRTTSVLPSPDDAWVAILQEQTCTDGWFVTTFVHVVQLVRPSKAAEAVRSTWQRDTSGHENDVLAVQMGSSDSPLLQWMSTARLEVTIPNKAGIGLHKNSYEGVEIVVKFDPDHPLERKRHFEEIDRFLGRKK